MRAPIPAAVFIEAAGEDDAGADLEPIVRSEPAVQLSEGVRHAAPEDRVGVQHELIQRGEDILDGHRLCFRLKRGVLKRPRRVVSQLRALQPS